ncbi:MAG: MFS transporter [bacterium]
MYDTLVSDKQITNLDTLALVDKAFDADAVVTNLKNQAALVTEGGQALLDDIRMVYGIDMTLEEGDIGYWGKGVAEAADANKFIAMGVILGQFADMIARGKVKVLDIHTGIETEVSKVVTVASIKADLKKKKDLNEAGVADYIKVLYPELKDVPYIGNSENSKFLRGVYDTLVSDQQIINIDTLETEVRTKPFNATDVIVNLQKQVELIQYEDGNIYSLISGVYNDAASTYWGKGKATEEEADKFRVTGVVLAQFADMIVSGKVKVLNIHTGEETIVEKEVTVENIVRDLERKLELKNAGVDEFINTLYGVKIQNARYRGDPDSKLRRAIFDILMSNEKISNVDVVDRKEKVEFDAEKVIENLRNQAALMSGSNGEILNYIAELYEGSSAAYWGEGVAESDTSFTITQVALASLASNLWKTDIKRINIITGEVEPMKLKKPLEPWEVIGSLRIQAELKRKAFDFIRNWYGLSGVPYRGDEARSPIVRQVFADIADRILNADNELLDTVDEYLEFLMFANRILEIIRDRWGEIDAKAFKEFCDLNKDEIKEVNMATIGRLVFDKALEYLKYQNDSKKGYRTIILDVAPWLDEWIEAMPYAIQLRDKLTMRKDLLRFLKMTTSFRGTFEDPEDIEWLFSVAKNMGMRLEKPFRDVATYIAVIDKMSHEWSRIEKLLGRKISVSPDKGGFSYEIKGGILTINYHDGITEDILASSIREIGASYISINFVSPNITLEEASKKWATDEKGLIKEATAITSISVRTGVSDIIKGEEIERTVYFFNEDGRRLWEEFQYYNLRTGNLTTQIRDNVETRYEYDGGMEYGYLNTTNKFVAIPTHGKTYVKGRPDLLIKEFRNVLDKDIQTGDQRLIDQWVTYHAGEYKGRVAHQYLDKNTGTTQTLYEGDIVDGSFAADRVTEYSLNDPVLNVLGIAESFETFEYFNGQKVTKMLTGTYKGVSEYNGASFEIIDEEVKIRRMDYYDAMGNIMESQITTQLEGKFVPEKIVMYHYDNSYYKAYGAATHTQEFICDSMGDQVIPVTERFMLGFNEFGGMNVFEKDLVRDTAKLKLTDYRNRTVKEYSDDPEQIVDAEVLINGISYNASKLVREDLKDKPISLSRLQLSDFVTISVGNISAGYVTEYSFEDKDYDSPAEARQFRSRGVAAGGVRYFWNSVSHRKEDTVERTIKTIGYKDITLESGIKERALVFEEHVERNNLGKRVAVGLVNGFPVQEITGKVIDGKMVADKVADYSYEGYAGRMGLVTSGQTYLYDESSDDNRGAQLYESTLRFNDGGEIRNIFAVSVGDVLRSIMDEKKRVTVFTKEVFKNQKQQLAWLELKDTYDRTHIKHDGEIKDGRFVKQIRIEYDFTGELGRMGVGWKGTKYLLDERYGGQLLIGNSYLCTKDGKIIFDENEARTLSADQVYNDDGNLMFLQTEAYSDLAWLEVIDAEGRVVMKYDGKLVGNKFIASTVTIADFKGDIGRAGIAWKQYTYLYQKEYAMANYAKGGILLGTSDLCDEENNLIQDVDKLAAKYFGTIFDDKGRVRMLQRKVFDKLAFIEVIDHHGKVVMKFDGEFNEAEQRFEAQTATVYHYDGLFGIIKKAWLGYTYFYENGFAEEDYQKEKHIGKSSLRDSEGKYIEDINSVTLDNFRKLLFDSKGRIQLLQEQTYDKLAWIEFIDGQGNVVMKRDGEYNETSKEFNATTATIYDFDGFFGILKKAWKGYTYLHKEGFDDDDYRVSNLMIGDSVLCDRYGNIVTDINAVSRRALFDSKGRIRILQRQRYDKLAWEETVNHHGKVTMKLDGEYNKNTEKFEARIATVFEFKGKFGILKKAWKGHKYLYRADFKEEMYLKEGHKIGESVLLDNEGNVVNDIYNVDLDSLFDGQGRIRLLQRQVYDKLAWIEVIDNHGKVVMKIDGEYDEYTKKFKPVTVTLYDFEGDFGILKKAWKGRTYFYQEGYTEADYRAHGYDIGDSILFDRYGNIVEDIKNAKLEDLFDDKGRIRLLQRQKLDKLSWIEVIDHHGKVVMKIDGEYNEKTKQFKPATTTVYDYEGEFGDLKKAWKGRTYIYKEGYDENMYRTNGYEIGDSLLFDKYGNIVEDIKNAKLEDLFDDKGRIRLLQRQKLDKLSWIEVVDHHGKVVMKIDGEYNEHTKKFEPKTATVYEFKGRFGDLKKAWKGYTYLYREGFDETQYNPVDAIGESVLYDRYGNEVDDIDAVMLRSLFDSQGRIRLLQRQIYDKLAWIEIIDNHGKVVMKIDGTYDETTRKFKEALVTLYDYEGALSYLKKAWKGYTYLYRKGYSEKDYKANESELIMGRSRLCKPDGTLVDNIEVITEEQLSTLFDSEGNITILQERVRNKLAWQEVIDKHGKVVVKYDGFINDAGEFVRTSITFYRYEGVFGDLKKSWKGFTYDYQKDISAETIKELEALYQAREDKSLFGRSRLCKPDGKLVKNINAITADTVKELFDKDGNIIILQELVKDKKFWQEVIDHHGRVVAKYDGYIDSEGEFQRETVTFYEFGGDIQWMEIGWKAKTYLYKEGYIKEQYEYSEYTSENLFIERSFLCDTEGRKIGNINKAGFDSIFDKKGRTIILIDSFEKGLAWQEKKTPKGDIDVRYDGILAGDTFFRRTVTEHHYAGKLAQLKRSWKGEVYIYSQVLQDKTGSPVEEFQLCRTNGTLVTKEEIENVSFADVCFKDGSVLYQVTNKKYGTVSQERRLSTGRLLAKYNGYVDKNGKFIRTSVEIPVYSRDKLGILNVAETNYSYEWQDHWLYDKELSEIMKEEKPVLIGRLKGFKGGYSLYEFTNMRRRMKPIWQEYMDPYGRTLIRYDGKVINGTFVRKRITEFKFDELWLSNKNPRTSTSWVYEPNAPENKGEKIAESTYTVEEHEYFKDFATKKYIKIVTNLYKNEKYDYTTTVWMSEFGEIQTVKDDIKNYINQDAERLLYNLPTSSIVKHWHKYDQAKGEFELALEDGAATLKGYDALFFFVENGEKVSLEIKDKQNNDVVIGDEGVKKADAKFWDALPDNHLFFPTLEHPARIVTLMAQDSSIRSNNIRVLPITWLKQFGIDINNIQSITVKSDSGAEMFVSPLYRLGNGKGDGTEPVNHISTRIIYGERGEVEYRVDLITRGTGGTYGYLGIIDNDRIAPWVEFAMYHEAGFFGDPPVQDPVFVVTEKNDYPDKNQGFSIWRPNARLSQIHTLFRDSERNDWVVTIGLRNPFEDPKAEKYQSSKAEKYPEIQSYGPGFKIVYESDVWWVVARSANNAFNQSIMEHRARKSLDELKNELDKSGLLKAKNIKEFLESRNISPEIFKRQPTPLEITEEQYEIPWEVYKRVYANRFDTKKVKDDFKKHVKELENKYVKGLNYWLIPTSPDAKDKEYSEMTEQLGTMPGYMEIGRKDLAEAVIKFCMYVTDNGVKPLFSSYNIVKGFEYPEEFNANSDVARQSQPTAEVQFKCAQQALYFAKMTNNPEYLEFALKMLIQGLRFSQGWDKDADTWQKGLAKIEEGGFTDLMPIIREFKYWMFEKLPTQPDNFRSGINAQIYGILGSFEEALGNNKLTAKVSASSQEIESFKNEIIRIRELQKEWIQKNGWDVIKKHLDDVIHANLTEIFDVQTGEKDVKSTDKDKVTPSVIVREPWSSTEEALDMILMLNDLKDNEEITQDKLFRLMNAIARCMTVKAGGLTGLDRSLPIGVRGDAIFYKDFVKFLKVAKAIGYSKMAQWAEHHLEAAFYQDPNNLGLPIVSSESRSEYSKKGMETGDGRRILPVEKNEEKRTTKGSETPAVEMDKWPYSIRANAGLIDALTFGQGKTSDVTEAKDKFEKGNEKEISKDEKDDEKIAAEQKQPLKEKVQSLLGVASAFAKTSKEDRNTAAEGKTEETVNIDKEKATRDAAGTSSLNTFFKDDYGKWVNKDTFLGKVTSAYFWIWGAHLVWTFFWAFVRRIYVSVKRARLGSWYGTRDTFVTKLARRLIKRGGGIVAEVDPSEESKGPDEVRILDQNDEQILMNSFRRWSDKILGRRQLMSYGEALSHTFVGDGPVEGNFLLALRSIYMYVLKWQQENPEDTDDWINGMDEFSVMACIYMRKIMRDEKKDTKSDYTNSNDIWHRMELMTIELSELMRDALAEGRYDVFKKYLGELGVQRREASIDINDINLGILESDWDAIHAELDRELQISEDRVNALRRNIIVFVDREGLKPTSGLFTDFVTFLPTLFFSVLGIIGLRNIQVGGSGPIGVLFNMFNSAVSSTIGSSGPLGVFFGLFKSIASSITLPFTWYWAPVILLSISVLLKLSAHAYKTMGRFGRGEAPMDIQKVHSSWNKLIEIGSVIFRFFGFGSLLTLSVYTQFMKTASFDIMFLNMGFIAYLAFETFLAVTAFSGNLLDLFGRRGLANFGIFKLRESMSGHMFKYFIRPPALTGGARAIISYHLLNLASIIFGSYAGLFTFGWFENFFVPGDIGNMLRLAVGMGFFGVIHFITQYGIWQVMTGAGSFASVFLPHTLVIGTSIIALNKSALLIWLPGSLGKIIGGLLTGLNPLFLVGGSVALVAATGLYRKFVINKRKRELDGAVLGKAVKKKKKIGIVFFSRDWFSYRYKYKDKRNEATETVIKSFEFLLKNEDKGLMMNLSKWGLEGLPFDEQISQARTYIKALHDLEYSEGKDLFDLMQIRDHTLPDDLRIDLQPTDNQQHIELGWAMRCWLGEVVAEGGDSPNVPSNLVAQAHKFAELGIGRRVCFYLISNNWKPLEQDRPSEMGEDIELIARNTLCRLLEYILNNGDIYDKRLENVQYADGGNSQVSQLKTTGDKDVSEIGTAYTLHAGTCMPFKAATMTAMDLIPEETLNLSTMVVMDRGSIVHNVNDFGEDLLKHDTNPNMVITLPGRATTSTLMAVGQASQNMEEGHRSYDRAVKRLLGGDKGETVGTGWGNILSVLYGDSMRVKLKYANQNSSYKHLPVMPITSRLFYERVKTRGLFHAIFAYLWGLLSYIPHAVGISEDIWAVGQLMHAFLGHGRDPKVTYSKALWQKLREAWSHIAWPKAAYPRWSGGALQYLDDYLMQLINEFGPLSIYSKSVRRQGARFFLIARYATFAVSMSSVAILFNLSSFIGIVVGFWVVGFMLNQVLKIHGLVAYLEATGFNEAFGFGGGIAALALVTHLTGLGIMACMPYAALGFIIGGFIIGLGKWLAGIPRDFLSFGYQFFINTLAQRFFYVASLLFVMSGGNETPHSTEVKHEALRLDQIGNIAKKLFTFNREFYSKPNFIYLSVFVYLGLVLTVLSFIAIAPLSILHGAMVYPSLLLPVSLVGGAFLMTVRPGATVLHGWGDIIAKFTGVVSGAVTLYGISVMLYWKAGMMAAGVSSAIWPILPVVGFGLFVIIQSLAIMRIIYESPSYKWMKFVRLKIMSEGSKLNKFIGHEKIQRIISEMVRGQWITLLFFSWFLILPVTAMVGMDIGIFKIGISYEMLMTGLKYIAAAGLSIVVIGWILEKFITNPLMKRRFNRIMSVLEAGRSYLSDGENSIIGGLKKQATTFTSNRSYAYAHGSLSAIMAQHPSLRYNVGRVVRTNTMSFENAIYGGRRVHRLSILGLCVSMAVAGGTALLAGWYFLIGAVPYFICLSAVVIMRRLTVKEGNFKLELKRYIEDSKTVSRAKSMGYAVTFDGPAWLPSSVDSRKKELYINKRWFIKSNWFVNLLRRLVLPMVLTHEGIHLALLNRQKRSILASVALFIGEIPAYGLMLVSFFIMKELLPRAPVAIQEQELDWDKLIEADSDERRTLIKAQLKPLFLNLSRKDRAALVELAQEVKISSQEILFDSFISSELQRFAEENKKLLQDEFYLSFLKAAQLALQAEESEKQKKEIMGRFMKWFKQFTDQESYNILRYAHGDDIEKMFNFMAGIAPISSGKQIMVEQIFEELVECYNYELSAIDKARNKLANLERNGDKEEAELYSQWLSLESQNLVKDILLQEIFTEKFDDNLRAIYGKKDSAYAGLLDILLLLYRKDNRSKVTRAKAKYINDEILIDDEIRQMILRVQAKIALNTKQESKLYWDDLSDAWKEKFTLWAQSNKSKDRGFAKEKNEDKPELVMQEAGRLAKESSIISKEFSQIENRQLLNELAEVLQSDNDYFKPRVNTALFELLWSSYKKQQTNMKALLFDGYGAIPNPYLKELAEEKNSALNAISQELETITNKDVESHWKKINEDERKAYELYAKKVVKNKAEWKKISKKLFGREIKWINISKESKEQILLIFSKEYALQHSIVKKHLIDDIKLNETSDAAKMLEALEAGSEGLLPGAHLSLYSKLNDIRINELKKKAPGKLLEWMSERKLVKWISKFNLVKRISKFKLMKWTSRFNLAKRISEFNIGKPLDRINSELGTITKNYEGSYWANLPVYRRINYVSYAEKVVGNKKAWKEISKELLGKEILWPRLSAEEKRRVLMQLSKEYAVEHGVVQKHLINELNSIPAAAKLLEFLEAVHGGLLPSAHLSLYTELNEIKNKAEEKTASVLRKRGRTTKPDINRQMRKKLLGAL